MHRSGFGFISASIGNYAGLANWLQSKSALGAAVSVYRASDLATQLLTIPCFCYCLYRLLALHNALAVI
jgi:hypothetical protein